MAFRLTVGFNFTVAFWGTAQLDGIGSATVPVEYNSDGVLGGPVTYNPTYSVQADGRLAFDLTGTGYEMEGQVMKGGDLAVINGSSAGGFSPTVIVMIREGAGLDSSALQGTYFAVGLDLDVSTSKYRSVTGTLVADGAGNGMLDVVENVEGIVSAAPEENVFYGVASDGSLTMLAGGTSYEGGVTASGQVAVLAGGKTMGSDPRILILVK